MANPLGEVMISEGMACLYEEQHTGQAPMYTSVVLKDEQVARARRVIHDEDYSHAEWLFGAGAVDRWFGYALGYRLCKIYAKKVGQSAAQLVHTEAADILAESLPNFSIMSGSEGADGVDS